MRRSAMPVPRLLLVIGLVACGAVALPSCAGRLQEPRSPSSTAKSTSKATRAGKTTAETKSEWRPDPRPDVPTPPPPPPPSEPPSTETYARIVENRFVSPRQQPVSTFSIDVDTAAYSNVRRFLNENKLPPKDAVRLEEMINYFPYGYAPPKDGEPFATYVEAATCPWKPEHRLVRIGLKGKEYDAETRPPLNLVFLIDVSGSMSPPNRLPLVKQGLKLLLPKLTNRDRVAIVVYAGSSGLVLPSTHGDNREAIMSVLNKLEAGGSTNGGAGIQLAYSTAQASFIKGGSNRVILCTDGDFNVGTTNTSELIRLVQEKAKTGVFLSALGFGIGNLKDSTLEQIADKGNGNYAYLDNLQEATKVLVEQMTGTLFAIAKDVKIQVEFNPARVAAYRLIGYENRLLAKEDFNDDTKDAGEIGAGHTVTALYEVVPVGVKVDLPNFDNLKYQAPEALPEKASKEMLTVKLRYKAPDEDKSKLLEVPLTDAGLGVDRATGDFKFQAAVAAFGLLLRDSEYKGDATFAKVRELAMEGRGDDKHGHRSEFIKLVERAQTLKRGE